MRRRERKSWIGLDIEPSLEEKRRASLGASRVVGALIWIAAAGLGFFSTYCYLSASR